MIEWHFFGPSERPCTANAVGVVAYTEGDDPQSSDDGLTLHHGAWYLISDEPDYDDESGIYTAAIFPAGEAV